MYVRIVLLALVAGKVGDDFVTDEPLRERLDESIFRSTSQPSKKKEPYSEGVRPIYEGLVIDHICRGMTRLNLAPYGPYHKVMNLDEGKGEWSLRAIKTLTSTKGLSLDRDS